MSNLQKPFADGIAKHVQMSTGMSEDKFLEMQRHKCLPMEVMINPLMSWFTEQGCNYPVGALEWAQNFVEGDITIYSTVFHQPHLATGRRHDIDAKSGSVSLVSVIAITVSKIGSSKEVKVEMTVGHDKIMTITNEKLLLKDKHSNKVFELWYRITRDGVLTWRKTHALRGVVSDENDAFPPVFLASYGERMVNFVCSHLMHSSEDLRLFREKMNELLRKTKDGHHFPINLRTPTLLETSYYSAVENINKIINQQTSQSVINALIEEEFNEFIQVFRQFLTSTNKE